jgi:cytoskeletal protein RodZ
MHVGGPVTSDDLAPSSGQLQLWGSQIKDAREAAGIPIGTIADSLNLRVSFVAALENGRGNVHMEWPYERQHLRAIAKRLGVTLHEEIVH